MSIYKEQQRPYIRKCLAVQRKLYSKGKTCNNWQLVLLVLGVLVMNSPPLLVKLGILVSISENIQAFCALMNVIFIFGVQSCSAQSKCLQSKAALIQQYVDADLYSLVTHTKRKEWHHVKDKAEIDSLLGDYPGDDGLINTPWYGDYSQEKPEQQVLNCQLENIKWDSWLREAFIYLLQMLTAMAIVLVVICFIFAEGRVSTLLWGISGGLPVLRYCYQTHQQLKKDKSALEEMKKMANQLMIQMQEGQLVKNEVENQLIQLQQLIFKSRKSCFLIPDWFNTKHSKMNQVKIEYWNKISKEE